MIYYSKNVKKKKTFKKCQVGKGVILFLLPPRPQCTTTLWKTKTKTSRISFPWKFPGCLIVILIYNGLSCNPQFNCIVFHPQQIPNLTFFSSLLSWWPPSFRAENVQNTNLSNKPTPATKRAPKTYMFIWLVFMANNLVFRWPKQNLHIFSMGFWGWKGRPWFRQIPQKNLQHVTKMPSDS